MIFDKYFMLLIFGYILLWHIIGFIVNTIIDETEHTPMGWSSMMPDWIPIWLYTTIWPITLILSLVRNDD